MLACCFENTLNYFQCFYAQLLLDVYHDNKSKSQLHFCGWLHLQNELIRVTEIFGIELFVDSFYY